MIRFIYRFFVRISWLLALLVMGMCSHVYGESRPIQLTVGYEHFCRRDYPELCSGLDPTPAKAGIDFVALVHFNWRVNHSFPYKADVGMDHWDVDPDAGDCDDYAVSKLYHLMRWGIPRQALRLAITLVRDRNGNRIGHLVLLVDTDKGTFVLDSLEDAVLTVQERPDLKFYAVEKISTTGFTALFTWDGH